MKSLACGRYGSQHTGETTPGFLHGETHGYIYRSMGTHVSFIFRGYKVITHNLVFKTFIFPLLGSMGTWTVDFYGYTWILWAISGDEAWSN